MQKALLPYLVCPLTGSDLQLTVIESAGGDDITTGILFAGSGMFYPVLQGVPRLLPNSFLTHGAWLQQHLPDYGQRKETALSRFGDQVAKNTASVSATQKSFSREWKTIEKNRQVAIWNLDKNEFEAQLWQEIGLANETLAPMCVFDIGCGHGISSQLLAKKARLVIGMDVSDSVMGAQAANARNNCHYIQADLQFMPFRDGMADLVYASGVLHHTPDTVAAFRKAAAKVKPGGYLTVWLYKPYDNVIHKLMCAARPVTSSIPARWQWWLYAIFLLPFLQLASWLRGKKKHWRTNMINLMDILSPQYRTEQLPSDVAVWYHHEQFEAATISSENRFGFSMTARKAP